MPQKATLFFLCSPGCHSSPASADPSHVPAGRGSHQEGLVTETRRKGDGCVSLRPFHPCIPCASPLRLLERPPALHPGTRGSLGRNWGPALSHRPSGTALSPSWSSPAPAPAGATGSLGHGMLCGQRLEHRAPRECHSLALAGHPTPAQQPPVRRGRAVRQSPQGPQVALGQPLARGPPCGAAVPPPQRAALRSLPGAGAAPPATVWSHAPSVQTHPLRLGSVPGKTRLSLISEFLLVAELSLQTDHAPHGQAGSCAAQTVVPAPECTGVRLLCAAVQPRHPPEPLTALHGDPLRRSLSPPAPYCTPHCPPHCDPCTPHCNPCTPHDDACTSHCTRRTPAR